MKRYLSILLALVMTLAMLPALANADATTTVEIMYSPWASTPYSGVDPYEAYLEGKYNVDFVLNPSADFATEVLTRFASGDAPDLLLLNNNQLNTLYDQGVLLDDWTPFLDKMPTTAANITDAQKRFFDRDGKLICLPTPAGPSTWSFMVRKDWMATLGLSMPTTLDELLDMMRAFTFKDPDGNGVDDTYGFTSAGGNESTGELINFLKLFGDNNYHIAGDEVQHPITDGAYLEYLKYAKTIVSEGLIDPDWYTQGWDERKPNLYSGKFGICWYPPDALLAETNDARNFDNACIDMWDVLEIPCGKLEPAGIYHQIRTVSADAAADEAKMAAICGYLDDNAWPNRDYYVVRKGLDIDAMDVMIDMGGGWVYLGYSSPEQYAKRQRQYGSIMYGWGQLLSTGMECFCLGMDPQPDAVASATTELCAKRAQIAEYPIDFRLLNLDPTLTEETERVANEFEISYILGDVTDDDYEAFKEEWLASGGAQLLEDAKATFVGYGLMK